MNERLQEDHCPDGVELGGSHTFRNIQPPDRSSKRCRLKSVCVYLTHTDAHTPWLSRPRSPHSPAHPHTDRIRKTLSGVCEAAPHTKKHLGTGLVGLQRIHICPVQAIGIQSFTLSNATRREQSQPELFFALAAPL